MWYIESKLPFLEEAPVVGSGKNIVNTKSILFPESLESTESEVVYLPSVLVGLLVKPLNVFVIKNLNLRQLAYLKTLDVCTIQYDIVDYSFVVSSFNNSLEDEGAILYPALTDNSYTKEEISSKDLIDKAELGEIVNREDSLFSDLDAEVFPTPINEALSLDDLRSRLKYLYQDSESDVMLRLKSYFEGGYKTNRVPLLVGQSAVGKSAVIKSLAAKYNMRVVDIRTAFMTRLDIEGLTQIINLNGNIESFNCPMSSLVEATDNYVDYCSKVVELLEDRIEHGEDISEELLNKYKEGAKIPVLFFDEVTRGESSVRQALTKIFTDKEFNGMKFSKARVVAATNAPLDENLPQELFQTKDIDDVAFFDRFESIQITPESFFESWKQWASSKSNKYNGTNIHPDILDYVTSSVSIAYDTSPLLKEVDDINELTTTVYPNFRTWERISDYLYSIKDKNYSVSVIDSIIGKQASKGLQSVLSKKGYSIKKPSSDFITQAVEDGMDSGLPTMLISPSSLGKTSRVKKAVIDRGYSFIDVNLGQLDRLDLSGPPAKISIDDYVLSGVELPEDLKDQFRAITEECGLPNYVTTRAPKKSLVDKFIKAQKNGKKVVIFYDEMNRVVNPSIMSSVFEAISDHRAFGIDFDPDSVIIMAACNLGDNVQDARELDSAIANRFSVYWKKKYDDSDVDSFIKYAETNGLNKNLLYILQNKPKKDVLSIIKSVDTRTLETSASSTRGIEDLSKFLDDNNHNGIMKGFLFSGTLRAKNAFQAVLTGSFSNANTQIFYLLDLISKHIDTWVGRYSSGVLSRADGSTVTGEDIYNLVKSSKSELFSDPQANKELIKNLLRLIWEFEYEAINKRENIFKMFLGDNSNEFLNTYNQISGTEIEVIKIEDLIDESKISKYYNQELRETNMNDLSPKVIEIIKDIRAQKFPTMTKDWCRELIKSSLDLFSTNDGKFKFMTSFCSMAYGDNVCYIASDSNNDKDYIKNILSSVGVK